MDAGKAGSTCASEGVDIVCTGPSIFAGVALAFIDFQSTSGAHKARQAATVV